MKRLLGYGISVAWLACLYLVVPIVWGGGVESWVAIVFVLAVISCGVVIGWRISTTLQGRNLVVAGFVSFILYACFRVVGDYGFFSMLSQDLLAGQAFDHLSEIGSRNPEALAIALFFNLIVSAWMLCAAIVLLMDYLRNTQGRPGSA